MTWRNAEFEDLARIELPANPIEQDMRSMVPDTAESRAMLKENARTWEEDGRIIAIVGVAPLWKGVGTVWTLLTDEARERGVPLSLGVLRFMRMLDRDRGYWRLQATTEQEDEPARLWIASLGFRYEGRMIAYGPDAKTHDMHARVRL